MAEKESVKGRTIQIIVPKDSELLQAKSVFGELSYFMNSKVNAEIGEGETPTVWGACETLNYVVENYAVKGKTLAEAILSAHNANLAEIEVWRANKGTDVSQKQAYISEIERLRAEVEELKALKGRK